MKNTAYISLVALMAVCLGGCLTTGQIVITEHFGDGVTTNTSVNSYDVDLNTNEDYVDNKDKIKSIDAISIVAVVKNNLPGDAQAKFYISDDPSLTDPDDIMDPKQATLVFVSPVVPGNNNIRIDWADGFKYIENEAEIEKQVLGDGIFTVYAIGRGVEFNLNYKAEVSITLTVSL